MATEMTKAEKKRYAHSLYVKAVDNLNEQLEKDIAALKEKAVQKDNEAYALYRKYCDEIDTAKEE